MELKTKSGRLTRYGLACGYIERRQSPDNDTFRVVTLEMSGSVLHVNTYQRETGERRQLSTRLMSVARKVFSQERRRLGI